MRTVTEIETNVPAFLGKLWKLVEDPDTDELICWSINGRSFFIRNPAQFARDLLPHYYKHNNMASFVRQLNMYGFHKKVSVELGGLKCDRDEMEFAHQYFVKDHPYLLEHIKRKIASNKMQDSHPPIKAEVMNKVLAEVRTMRGKQEHLDSKLGHMKQQNESLWREISVLRRKHAKQQEIVNKLIHFLVTLVQPNRNSGLSVKRRYPLMIDSHQRHKQAKTSKSGTSPTGPVIHELHETDPNTDLDSEYIVAEILENHHYPSVQSPKSTDDILDNEIQESEQLIEQSLAVDNDDDDEYLQTPVISPKRKHLLKPKRKRKHKVPVKITIPPTDIGEQLREETLMVEMNLDDEEVGEEALDVKKVPIIPQKIKDKKSVPIKAKPIPMKTVRSSKLAAMAANINKMSEQNDSDEDGDGDDDDDNDNNNNNNNNDDHDTDHDDLITNDTDDVNLDNMLIIPDMEKPNTFGASGSLSDTQQFNQNNPGSSDKTQDLSLSCINTLSGTDSDIRLGPIEEIGSHVNEVQANIDMIRDQCMRGEFQSLDASALLSVLSCNDDLMGSYDDFPMNPDFDIISREGNSEEQQNAGGELMAYNPTPSLLDFSEAMFNDIDNSSPVGTSALTECYNQDPLNLEDSKALLVESLLSDANANKSGNS